MFWSPPQLEGGGDGCGLGHKNDRGCGDSQYKAASDELWAERPEAHRGRGENSFYGQSCEYFDEQDEQLQVRDHYRPEVHSPRRGFPCGISVGQRLPE